LAPALKSHVTLPFVAILTLSGLNDVPAPLTVTEAVVGSGATVAVVVAVCVVPPDVNDART
jgi:hypothetical protein